MVRAGLLLAAFASLAAWADFCAHCRKSALHLPIPLAAVGALFYAVAAVAAFRAKFAVVAGLVGFAVGFHAVLSGHLALSREFCAMCLLTFAGAALAGFFAWRLVRPNAGVVPIVLLTGAIAGVAVLEAHHFRERREMARLTQEIAAELRASGQFQDGVLFVLTQPDCGYCDQVKAETLPALEREFGERLPFVLSELSPEFPVPAFFLAQEDGAHAISIGFMNAADVRRWLEALGILPESQ